ncbi:MAG: GIY-YIG nuclease family protein [Spirochaetia bacterium]|nr:GIY-YIG nuclease family protein [Spirochaetia bacterium]
MNKQGKTIQIFLPNGNPKSIKIAEVTTRNVIAIYIPRAQLEEVSKRREAMFSGIYALIGDGDTRSKVYIGEADNCFKRLKQHHAKKDYWTHAIFFTTKNKAFTKTHVKYLEWISLEHAQQANRYEIDNSNSPSKPNVSEANESDLFDYFETIKLLSGTLGYPIFDEINKRKTKKKIFCKGKDAYAEGEFNEEGLIVFSGSTCNLRETDSAGLWIINTRRKLVDSKILKQKDGVIIFTSDYIFNSPSTAAAVVLGRRTNGWLGWKFADNKTLDQVYR